VLSFAAPVTDATVTLHDPAGRTLRVFTGARGAMLRVDCGRLADGVYLLRVREGGAQAESAIVVRRR
jgi:hypothetical protein